MGEERHSVGHTNRPAQLSETVVGAWNDIGTACVLRSNIHADTLQVMEHSYPLLLEEISHTFREHRRGLQISAVGRG